VGSHLAEVLVHAGYEVKALVRPTSDIALLRALEVEVVRGDITDPAAVERAVSGCQHVYHLAAKTTVSNVSKRAYYAANVEGTASVARAALKANAERLVYGSSAGVNGTVAGSPVDEHTEPHPDSHYRASKLMGEEVVMASRQKKGLPVVVARIASIYGPQSVSWRGLFQAIAARRFRIIGAGENRTHMGYVSDVVEGLQRCAETHGIEGQCYLLTGNEPLQLRQLVGAIAQELGLPQPQGSTPAASFRAFYALALAVYHSLGVELPYAHRYELFLTDRVFNIAKAQKELGYRPQVSMREGIRQTVRWYREKGYF
jgi:nucleoside-diphosphate-sugar epimerase